MTEPLSSRILKNMIGSCDCVTKTPDPKFHLDDCLYRVLSECYDVISAVEDLTKSVTEFTQSIGDKKNEQQGQSSS